MLKKSDRQNIIHNLRESAETKTAMIEACTDDILSAAEFVVRCFKSGNKLLLCGNGGSAADAQHIATEFVIRLSPQTTRPALPAIALTTDTSYLTAGSNDLGYEHVFARAVEALGRENDILLAISTSGNSENIINAIKLASSKKIITIGLLGHIGGKAKPLCTHSIVIPSDNTQRIQEGHITVGHILCEIVEKELFG
jgi:D-sedoheptulose 7-phosphate isomerase